jgi:hypothetical protein
MNNYTEVEKDVFEEIYRNFTNQDGRFKMITENEETKYYILTSFLVYV